MKIRKNIVYCCIIGLLSIITQAFGDEYDQYKTDLDKIRKEEAKQDNIISAASSVIVRAGENKKQTATALAAISCAPSLPTEDLVWKLYHHVKDHYGWYFYELGCTEDKLENVCRDKYASKSRKELEKLLHQLEHDKHRLKCVLFFRGHDHCGLEQALLSISLQNRLMEESYKKCHEMRTVLKQIDSEIAHATTDKNNANEKKHELRQKSIEKQQKLDHITKHRKVSVKQKKQDKVDTVVAIATATAEQVAPDATVGEQERLNKENAARAAYLLKYAAAIKELGLDRKGKEAELEQAFKNGTNLDEVVTVKHIADEKAAREAYLLKYAEAIKDLGLDQPGKEAELEQAFKNEINLDEVVDDERAEQESIELQLKLKQKNDAINEGEVLYDTIVM